MGAILSTTWRLLSRHWISVTAVLLVGWMAHYYLIIAAAAVASRFGLVGTGILPIAILLFLAAYTVVFRIFRSDMISFGDLPPDPVGSLSARAKSRMSQIGEIATAVILPFFLMWIAWGFFDKDIARYKDEVFRRWVYLEGGPEIRPIEFKITVLSVTVLLVAYVIKLLADLFAERWGAIALPGAYFEALWVFLASVLILKPLFSVVEWVPETNLWWSIQSWWDSILESFEWLRNFWQILEPTIFWGGRILTQILLPLAWFAIAALVLGRPLKSPEFRQDVLDKHPRLARRLETSRSRWENAPGPVRYLASEAVEDFTIRALSVVSAFAKLRSIGLVRVGFYVVAWNAIVWVGEWFTVFARDMVGPVGLGFWLHFYNILLVVPWLLFEPIKVALVAAVYDAAVVGPGEDSSGTNFPRAHDAYRDPQTSEHMNRIPERSRFTRLGEEQADLSPGES